MANLDTPNNYEGFRFPRLVYLDYTIPSISNRVAMSSSVSFYGEITATRVV